MYYTDKHLLDLFRKKYYNLKKKNSYLKKK